MLTKADPIVGDMPREALNEPAVRRRPRLARTSGDSEADDRLSVISAMLTWEQEKGRIEANHIRGFKRLYHADRAEIVWLPEHIDAFLCVVPIELQSALIIPLHTEERQADILRLPSSAYHGSTVTLRQSKSARIRRVAPLVTITCTRVLRSVLDGMERRSPLILTTKADCAFQKGYFARLWKAAATEAGVGSITLSGLDERVALRCHDL